MSIAQELRSQTVKQLAAEAKKASIAGWHAMRKDELVEVLVKLAKKHKTAKKTTPPKRAVAVISKKSAVKKNVTAKNVTAKNVTAKVVVETKKTAQPKPLPKAKESKKTKPVPVKSAETDYRLGRLKENLARYREMSGVYEGEQKDRLILMVRDPYWLHAYWELSTKLVERARAAMGVYWHSAKPIIRLYRLISDGLVQPRREHKRDIFLHGGVNNWYIDVQNPPATFQVEIGYVSSKGPFFPLASSNFVDTPESHVADKTESLDGNWLDVSKEFDRIFRLSGGFNKNNELKEVFEKQLKRPMSLPRFAKFGGNQSGNGRALRESLLTTDADVVVYGATDANVQLTIKGEPVRVMPDGTFSVRFTLPEKRHVYPIVATSADGIETQTVILAIERNTKVLETVFREGEDDE